jgi:hypothetical protein
MKCNRRLFYQAESRAWTLLLGTTAILLGTRLVASDARPPLTSRQSTLPLQRHTRDTEGVYLSKMAE